jgi:hypothetical protein
MKHSKACLLFHLNPTLTCISLDLLTQQNVIDVIMELLKHTRTQPPLATSSSQNSSRNLNAQASGFAALQHSAFSQSSASLFTLSMSSSLLQSPSLQTSTTTAPFLSPSQQPSRPVTPNNAETRSASYASCI